MKILKANKHVPAAVTKDLVAVAATATAPGALVLNTRVPRLKKGLITNWEDSFNDVLSKGKLELTTAGSTIDIDAAGKWKQVVRRSDGDRTA